MKVLSVMNGFNRGGIEVQLLQSLNELRRNGIEMDFCTTTSGSLQDAFNEHGGRFWRIPKYGNLLRTAKRFRALLSQNQYDCVHSNYGHVSGGYALAAAMAGVPIAVSIHGSEPASLLGWRDKPGLSQIRNAWLRWHRAQMDKHTRIFVGHSVVNIQNYNPQWQSQAQRFRVILNGIGFPQEPQDRDQARESLGIKQSELALLHIGSFRYEKNHRGLFQILKHVVKRNPNTKLICVGDGAGLVAAQQQVKQMGLFEHVRFAGTQSNVWLYYAASDVFVFPSIAEGFGNVLVESQGMGLPIVASDIPPHRESVSPPQQRFLFPLPDYENAADLVLQQAEAAKHRANPWVCQAQQFARSTFSIKRFAADLTQLYHDLASAGCGHCEPSKNRENMPGVACGGTMPLPRKAS